MISGIETYEVLEEGGGIEAAEAGGALSADS
jgi:hypothetical protein